MKNIRYIIRIKIILFTVLFNLSCDDLNLNPLSEGASDGWYSTTTEMRMSLDYLYTITFWNYNPDLLYFDNGGWLDSWTDDWSCRNNLTDISGGTINGQSEFVIEWWERYYTCIAAANLVIEKVENYKDNFDEDTYTQYIAEARFVRARMYSRLIFYWGDVPYYEETLIIDEAFRLGRTDKDEVLQSIYSDFDYAASNLPESYSGESYATKGAALALKARIANYMGDWETAQIAAKSCMDLGVYDLYPDFEDLFLTKTTQTEENIFSIARSTELGSWTDGYYIRPACVLHITPRSSGGNMFVWPSWDLFCSFLCTDGLPIDESPLFNPQKPFENRDPRCTATIVEFGTEHGGIIYQPHPDSLVTSTITGERITNNDTRSVTQWASWNAMAWKKGYDEDWYEDFLVAPEHVVIRYADVLLIYAEAKIELNDIDESVLDAINKVRARAYGVEVEDVGSYPAITAMDQEKLRQILRLERRMEFAFEGLRHADIIRWEMAEKVLNTGIYGMLDVEELRTKIVDTGLWFFAETPSIDEDGVADFTTMFNNGNCRILAQRYFDKTKNYLWPIPSTEVNINENLVQNPGY